MTSLAIFFLKDLSYIPSDIVDTICKFEDKCEMD